MNLGKGSTEKEASGPVGGEERSCLSVGQSCALQKIALSGYTFAMLSLKVFVVLWTSQQCNMK